MTMITVSLPKDTKLADVERTASERHGRIWRVLAGPRGVWADPSREENFVWLLREVMQ